MDNSYVNLVGVWFTHRHIQRTVRNFILFQQLSKRIYIYIHVVFTDSDLLISSSLYLPLPRFHARYNNQPTTDNPQPTFDTVNDYINNINVSTSPLGGLEHATFEGMKSNLFRNLTQNVNTVDQFS